MHVLAIKELKKSFISPDGEKNLVIDVPHFVLAPGEQVALEGASGSGKTTFLNLIAGILNPDQGSICLDDQEISSFGEAERDRLRANQIGYVFQTFNLIQGLTALQNIELGMFFGSRIDRKRARLLLDHVGLSSRADYFPRQLSVGQQQRVAVARALANNPKIVLADEPTGNLDTDNATSVLSLIRELCHENKAALLLVSHDRAILSQFKQPRSLHSINKATSQAGQTRASS